MTAQEGEMKIVDKSALAVDFCQATGKFLVYFTLPSYFTDKTLLLSMPWSKTLAARNYEEDRCWTQILNDDEGYVICDTEDAACELVGQTLHDNTTTPVYAVAYGPDGPITENT